MIKQGYTQWRSNLVSMYRFTEGRLKNFSIGGGVQYRDESYRGNLDVDRDGRAEEHWSPGYTLYTLMMSYRTRIAKRNVDFSLNGSWGEARSFRATLRTHF